MKKLLNKKGFTLMEMMIVIAIIVILVAISIPTFSGSLEKANKATDAANLRAAKAEYLAQDMNGEFTDTSKVYYYNFKTGKFEVADNAAGAETLAKSHKSIGSCENHKGSYITIDFAAKEVKWSGTYSTDCDTADVPDTTP